MVLIFHISHHIITTIAYYAIPFDYILKLYFFVFVLWFYSTNTKHNIALKGNFDFVKICWFLLLPSSLLPLVNCFHACSHCWQWTYWFTDWFCSGCNADRPLFVMMAGQGIIRQQHGQRKWPGRGLFFCLGTTKTKPLMFSASIANINDDVDMNVNECTWWCSISHFYILWFRCQQQDKETRNKSQS